LPVLGLKYFLKNGLKKIDDLPEKTISQMKFNLAINFDNKESFIKSMAKSGIDKERLSLIWRDQTHDAIENDRLDQAMASGKLQTKTWTTSGDSNCCPKCDALNGETVPIDSEFSCGTKAAHLHPDCNCSATFEKGEEPKNKVFSRDDLKKMSIDQYEQNRERILEQAAAGLIK
jgi:hypothetical protein